MQASSEIEIAQIVAISLEGCIGKGNDLPWHLPADLQHFKRMTTADTSSSSASAGTAEMSDTSGIVLMGRKTFESMNSRPLPKRMNVIITRQTDYAEQNRLATLDRVQVVHSLEQALAFARPYAEAHGLSTIWVIGGGEMFREALPISTRIELTQVHLSIEDGEAFYPPVPEAFRLVSRSEIQHDPKTGVGFEFLSYQRQP